MKNTHKIQVITTCNGCKWLTILKDHKGEKFAVVCENVPDDIEAWKPPFMIDFSYINPLKNDIPIPDNCPLEDYEPKI